MCRHPVVKPDFFLRLLPFILGFPSFLLLFFGGQVIIGILVFVLAAILTAIFLRSWVWPPSPFVILHNQTDIFIAGTSCHFRKHLRLKAKQNGLTGYTHRNLSATGQSATNFTINGRPVQPEEDGGDYLVYGPFGRAVRSGEEIEQTLELDFANCFPNPTTEWVSMLVDTRVKDMTIIVHFPQDKPSITSQVLRRRAGVDTPITPEPNQSPDRLTITWHKRRGMRRGDEYRVLWTW